MGASTNRSRKAKGYQGKLMVWLKIYDWEHQLYPREQKIRIKTEYRVAVARKLATKFNIYLRSVSLSKRGNRATTYCQNAHIALPNRHNTCGLGLILHELAHLYDYQYFKHSGHCKTFRKALVKLYVESKWYLKDILREVKLESEINLSSVPALCGREKTR